MLHQKINRIFSHQFSHGLSRIAFACIITLIAGICLFSGLTRANAVSIQADYRPIPDMLAIQQDSEDTFEFSQQEKQLLVDWISKRYPVNSKETELFVSTAYKTAHEMGLDPHLILAVMAIESSFNPEAESPAGAQGLMQVMTKVHSKRFEPHGGIKAAKDPVANIQVGSAILKEYVSRGGSVERGLKSYVGAAAYSHDFGYGAKVLAEYDRLKQVSLGKKVPTIIASKSTTKKLVRSDTDKSRVKVVLPAQTGETADA